MDIINHTTRPFGYQFTTQVPRVTNEQRRKWANMTHIQLHEKMDWMQERRTEAANVVVNPLEQKHVRENHVAWMFYFDAVLNELRRISAIVGQREMDEEFENA
jgi:hypothetical protein